MPSRRKIRLALALAILLISVTLLIWGTLPLGRRTQSLPVSPAEMQLPTPDSRLPPATYLLL